ncbi:hypothetical protein VTN96DRAFT_7646 [Rasamsonia emersonii]
MVLARRHCDLSCTARTTADTGSCALPSRHWIRAMAFGKNDTGQKSQACCLRGRVQCGCAAVHHEPTLRVAHSIGTVLQYNGVLFLGVDWQGDHAKWSVQTLWGRSLQRHEVQSGRPGLDLQRILVACGGVPFRLAACFPCVDKRAEPGPQGTDSCSEAGCQPGEAGEVQAEQLSGDRWG